MSDQEADNQQPSYTRSEFRRLLMEQFFWGLFGPLVPNVILMAGIYNLAPQGTAFWLVVGIYWLLISLLISYVVAARAHFSQFEGSKKLLLIGAQLGTLLVVLFAQWQWTIFATFQEAPIDAFMFILLINLLGTLGAMLGFHIQRIREAMRD